MGILLCCLHFRFVKLVCCVTCHLSSTVVTVVVVVVVVVVNCHLWCVQWRRQLHLVRKLVSSASWARPRSSASSSDMPSTPYCSNEASTNQKPSTERHATLERWTFDVSTNTELEGASADATVAAKPEKELSGEIAAILRQITASVSFLPLIDEPCAFDLLAYADSSVDVPMEWEEGDARLIAKSAQVRLRSFNTNAHQ